MKTKLLIAALTLSLGVTPSYGSKEYAQKTCPKGAVYSQDKENLLNVIIEAAKKKNNDSLTEFKFGGKSWLIHDKQAAIIKEIVPSLAQFKLNNARIIKNQRVEDVLVCEYKFISSVESDKNGFTLMMVDKIKDTDMKN